MKRYNKFQNRASTETQKPDPLAELRGARSNLAQCAVRLQFASLGVSSAVHARHLATLSRLSREASRPILFLINQLESEAQVGA